MDTMELLEAQKEELLEVLNALYYHPNDPETQRRAGMLVALYILEDKEHPHIPPPDDYLNTGKKEQRRKQRLNLFKTE